MIMQNLFDEVFLLSVLRRKEDFFERIESVERAFFDPGGAEHISSICGSLVLCSVVTKTAIMVVLAAPPSNEEESAVDDVDDIPPVLEFPAELRALPLLRLSEGCFAPRALHASMRRFDLSAAELSPDLENEVMLQELPSSSEGGMVQRCGPSSDVNVAFLSQIGQLGTAGAGTAVGGGGSVGAAGTTTMTGSVPAEESEGSSLANGLLIYVRQPSTCMASGVGEDVVGDAVGRDATVVQNADMPNRPVDLIALVGGSEDEAGFPQLQPGEEFGAPVPDWLKRCNLAYAGQQALDQTKPASLLGDQAAKSTFVAKTNWSSGGGLLPGAKLVGGGAGGRGSSTSGPKHSSAYGIVTVIYRKFFPGGFTYLSGRFVV